MKRNKSIWNEHQNPDKWIREYPECSVYEYLEKTSSEYRNLTALEFENRKFTYQSLIDSINAVARSLTALGIKKGDFVSIVTPNTPQAVFMIYAANRVGAVANILHPMLSASEIQKFVEDTNSKAILTLDMIYPKFAKIKWNMEKEPKMILARIVDALPWYAKPVYSSKNKLSLTFNPEHDVIYWNDFLGKGKSASLPEVSVEPDDTAVILYSGGTSGLPKGVMLTNRNINTQAVHAYDIGGIEDVIGEKSLALMPIFHGFGFAICVHAMFCMGFHIYLLPKYDFQKCTKLIFKKKINCIYGVPGLYEALIRCEEIEKCDLSFLHLLISGGDRLPVKLLRRVNKCLEKGGAKVKLREAYGQTECVAGCATNPHFDYKEGSAGIAYSDMEFKVVELGTQNELPDGQDGELCVSGPLLMKGYYKNPEATERALQRHSDGKLWLHTGDIFSKDENNFIYFCQRSTRMLISGGYNIYVTQVEDAISSCPSVAQSCVVGIEDRIYGEKIGAYVVLNNPEADKEAVKKKIMERCRESLAEYSLPHEIIFCDSLPVTNLGKIDYKALTKEINGKREN